MEKLYQKLERYCFSDYYPFHMPGHKRNPDTVDGDFLFERDITEIDGFDNLHHPEGVIKEAQNALSSLYGTKSSYYSVNGSTAALLSAISASVGQGGRILVARNCHKAVYHGIYLRNLTPVYLYPHANFKLGINGGISSAQVERLLEEDSKIEAVLITSPTYDGVVSDIKKIAEIVHQYGIPLIVDEAHGAHFRFSEYFPESAVELGADLVIQSFHKTLPSMTQTAVLHCCSDLVDEEKIKRFMGIFQTSSPSYILMSSLDACVDKLTRDGCLMYEKFTENLERTRKFLSRFRFIQLLSKENFTDEDVYDFDRSKLLFSTLHSSLNGRQLHQLLREEFHLEMEMDAENYVLAITSVGDTKDGLLRLCHAIEAIDQRESFKNINQHERKEETEEKEKTECACMEMKQKMTLSKAMDAPSKVCILEESIGKISAEFAYLYPPGIPIIVPGEQITGLFIRNVRRYLEQGYELQGLCDHRNHSILVVKEQADCTDLEREV